MGNALHTYTYMDVVLATVAGNVALGPANRARWVTIEAQQTSATYDNPPLFMGISWQRIIRQVQYPFGNRFCLGPNETLYVRSGLATAVNVHLIIEDSISEAIFTDSGSGVTEVVDGGRGATAVVDFIQPPGTERAAQYL